MASNHETRLTVQNLLYPLALIAFTLLLVITYQTKQILRDRDALNVTIGRQQKAFEDGQRLQNQLSALLIGTQKLAEGGNKNAKAIADKLKNLGIQIQTPETQKAAQDVESAPVPAAREKAEPGPVKP